jgi:hypothetical protein
MERTECSETSAFNIQTPGKCPEEIIPFQDLSYYCTLSVTFSVHIQGQAHSKWHTMGGGENKPMKQLWKNVWHEKIFCYKLLCPGMGRKIHYRAGREE